MMAVLLASLGEWAAARVMKLVTIGAGVVMLIGSCAYVEDRGGDKRQAKIERATDNASKAGKRAAERAATPGVRGQRDPTSRDD